MSQYKDEKTGKWYCLFRYHTTTGINKQVKKMGFVTKREAAKYEQEYKDRMEGSNDIKFATLAEAFKEDAAQRLKKTTQHNIIQHIRYLNKQMGEIEVRNITPLVIKNLYDNLRVKYRPRSGKSILTTFKAVLQFGRRFYGIKSAVEAVEVAGPLRYPEEAEEKENYWTLDEYKIFISRYTRLSRI